MGRAIERGMSCSIGLEGRWGRKLPIRYNATKKSAVTNTLVFGINMDQPLDLTGGWVRLQELFK